jgi:Ca-activated chloride channel family protein
MVRGLPFALLLPSAAFASDLDRTEAPYFMVKSVEPGVDRLPLVETRADVDIAGVIAGVRVTQIYANEGSRPIEAVYVFPGSTRAAVNGMKMTIGERTIVAKIERKDDARRIYERARAEGRSASLLEQHRPNVFQMNVANIMPGDRIVVELSYTELLVPEGGIYELVYPTVVGPRYTNTDPTERWIQNPYLENAEPPYRWDLTARIDAGMPIEALSSPTHQVSPRFLGANQVTVEVDDERGGDRDFILRYRLAGAAIQTGLLTFEGEDERFFLMMMQPPHRPAANLIPPREYIFVVDVSGSMSGFPIETSKELMRRLLQGLKSEDRFNVLLFAGANTVMSERSVEASAANIRKAIQIVDGLHGGGSTEILPAIRRTLAMPRDPEMSTTIVALTDGYVSVERELFDTIAKNLGTANLFAFGIGSSVNRHLIEGMARAGMGEPFIVLDAKSAGDAAERFARYVEAPVLTNVGVHFDGFDAYDVEPSSIPDVFAERPVILFGKYRGDATGQIVVEGRNALGPMKVAMPLSSAKPSSAASALRYLWARHRIAALSDVGLIARDPSLTEEVTELGLRYSLMTEHTSFVAVDSLVRNTDGAPVTVEQPLPLPEGVMGKSKGLASGPSHYLAPPKPSPTYRMRPPSTPAADPAPATAVDVPAEAEELDDDGTREPEKKREEARRPIRIEVRGVSGPIRAAILAHRGHLDRCLDRASATIRLRLEVGAMGRVDRLTIVSSSGSSEVDACVAGILRKLRLPAGSALELTIAMTR